LTPSEDSDVDTLGNVLFVAIDSGCDVESNAANARANAKIAEPITILVIAFIPLFIP
jgi:hypothetical protein